MVDLDKEYKAAKGQDTDFSPAPEDYYELRVKEIKPWTATKKTIKIIQRDENGKALKDDKGVNITVLSKDHEVYNTQVVLEIVGGEQDGKRIWHNLTTNPNAPWSIPSFLYGLGFKSLAASQIPTRCLGEFCTAKVGIDTYDKIITDKDTGLETVKVIPKNVIKFFVEKKEEEVVFPSDEEDDLV